MNPITKFKESLYIKSRLQFFSFLVLFFKTRLGSLTNDNNNSSLSLLTMTDLNHMREMLLFVCSKMAD